VQLPLFVPKREQYIPFSYCFSHQILFTLLVYEVVVCKREGKYGFVWMFEF